MLNRKAPDLPDEGTDQNICVLAFKIIHPAHLGCTTSQMQRFREAEQNMVHFVLLQKDKCKEAGMRLGLRHLSSQQKIIRVVVPY